MQKNFLSLLLIIFSSAFLVSQAQRFCSGVYCDANCQNCYPCQQEVNCKIADNCYCAKKTIPGGLPVPQTPQFVFLTFDDAITYENYVSSAMFNNMDFVLKNANIKDSMGCSPKLSVYLMGDTSDYNMPKFFEKTGSISYHTQTHTTGLNSPMNVWLNELQTLKNDFEALSKVKNVKGSRAPYLQANDAYLSVLQQLGVEYDSSFVYGWAFTSPEQEKNYWPFTLDYGVPDQMMCLYFGSCPTQSHAGLWEFPIVAFHTPEFIMDYNVYGDTAATLAAMKADFLASYNYNRVPRGYYIHWRYLTNNGDFDSLNNDRVNFLVDFFTWLSTLPDVIFTTEDKVIQWIKNPKNKDITKTMDIFQCTDQFITPANACPNGITTCWYNANPLQVCGRKCPQNIPGLNVNLEFLPSNIDTPHWTGVVSAVVFDSWPSGFCANLVVRHTNNTNAKGYLVSLSSLYSQATISAFWGYSQKDMSLDWQLNIQRGIGYSVNIPPNVDFPIGGFCVQTAPAGAYAADPQWIGHNLRFGIDLYQNQLTCPLGGCAVFCGNGRCDDETEGETAENCPFDCAPFA
jgi:hypothetical protein